MKKKKDERRLPFDLFDFKCMSTEGLKINFVLRKRDLLCKILPLLHSKLNFPCDSSYILPPQTPCKKQKLSVEMARVCVQLGGSKVSE